MKKWIIGSIFLGVSVAAFSTWREEDDASLLGMLREIRKNHRQTICESCEYLV